MEIFNVIFNSIKVFFATMDDMTFGGVLFGLLFFSLLFFLMSTKKAKKDKFIANYFLFYLSILFVVLAILLTYFV